MPKEVEVFRVPREGDGPAVIEVATMFVMDARLTCERHSGEWFLRRADAERALAARLRGGRVGQ